LGKASHGAKIYKIQKNLILIVPDAVVETFVEIYLGL